MDKKFYRIETEYEITNFNIDYIREWKLTWDGRLRIFFVDGVSYDISQDAKGRKELLKALQERTKGFENEQEGL